MDCPNCHNHVRKTDINNVVFSISSTGAIVGAFECPHCQCSYFIERKAVVDYIPFINDRRKEEQNQLRIKF